MNSDHCFGKLKTLDELEVLVSRLKDEGKRTVLANGCFDLLHVGHVRYLEAAKALGDCLIVALNSDESARTLKGPGRPILDQSARAEVVCAVRVVDYVCVFSESDVSSVLLRLKPDIHAKGTDYTEETVPEYEVVQSYGGRTAICGDPKAHASKSIIQLIKNSVGRER